MKETTLDKMYENQMTILQDFQQYKDSEQYSLINSQLVTVCKELNVMRIKEITGNGNNLQDNTE
jgi:hypothetical protein